MEKGSTVVGQQQQTHLQDILLAIYHRLHQFLYYVATPKGFTSQSAEQSVVDLGMHGRRDLGSRSLSPLSAPLVHFLFDPILV